MMTSSQLISILLANSAGAGGEDIVEAAGHGATAFEPILFGIVEIGLLTVIAGMILCLYRMLRGPHLADRVLAGDAFALHVVGLVILLTIRLESLVFFDAALVVAIIGFASTLAFAQYIGSQRSPAPTRDEGDT